MSQKDIKDLEQGHEMSIQEYNNMPLNDEEKEVARKALASEASILDKKRDSAANRRNATQRFNLDKKIRTESLELEQQKFNFEQKKFELEKAKYEDSKAERKFDRILKMAAIGLPVVGAIVTGVVNIIALHNQAKLTKQMIVLSYGQEGRVIPEYKDQRRSYDALVNKGLKG